MTRTFCACAALLLTLTFSACPDDRKVIDSCSEGSACTGGFICHDGSCLDPDGDLDADGVTNGVEWSAGTLLDNPDSDGDGFDDGTEFGSVDVASDRDGDGKLDALENDLADTDCDGLNDPDDDDDSTSPDAAAALLNAGCLIEGGCGGSTSVSCASVDGTLVYTCVYPDTYEVSESLCDGIDNDCDGDTDPGCCTQDADCSSLDEVAVCDSVDATGCVGSQVLGRCDAGACITETVAAPEACNSQPCGAAACVGADLQAAGLCTAGACVADAPVTCDDGDPCTVDDCDPLESRCTHVVTATADPELCNGLDDNCDGSTDEGLGIGDVCDVAGEPCVTGALACDGGGTVCQAGAPKASGEVCAPASCNGTVLTPERTCDGAGVCQVATDVDCADADACTTDSCDATGAGQCMNTALPATTDPELCNGLDDNCDGQTDEGWGLGDACTVVGQPCVDGILACDGSSGVECLAMAPKASGEVCAPASCAGMVLTPPSTCDGGGNCVAPATQDCADADTCTTDSCDASGAGQCVNAPVAATADPELCNGIDDNCDGQTDEGFTLGGACSTACIIDGAVGCVSDSETGCVGSTFEPNGTECAAGACVGDTLEAPDTCDGSGSCVTNGIQGCGNAGCHPVETACCLSSNAALGSQSVNPNRDLVALNNGDLAFCGNDSGGSQMWVTRVTSEFDLVWHRNYSTSSSYETCEGLVPTPDNGLIAMGQNGQNTSSSWIIRLDANGDQVWSTFLPGVDPSLADAVPITGGYAATGSFGDGSFVRFDESGTMIGTAQTYGGGSNDGLSALVQRSDGKFWLAGSNASYAGGWRAWYLLVSATGVAEIDQVTSNHDNYFDVLLMPNDGAVFIGRATNISIAAVRYLDASGAEIWSRTYSLGTNGTRFYSGALLSDGHIGVVGQTWNTTKALAAKLDVANGDVLWERDLAQSDGWAAVADQPGSFSVFTAGNSSKNIVRVGLDGFMLDCPTP